MCLSRHRGKAFASARRAIGRQPMTPEFPIRILFDDGEVAVFESPEDLLEGLDTIDSSDPRLWIRDALDRDVVLRMRGGIVETFEV